MRKVRATLAIYWAPHEGLNFTRTPARSAERQDCSRGETHLREIVKITAPEAHHRGEMAAEGIGAVIGRNPVATVLLSAAVGFVVGAMARR